MDSGSAVGEIPHRLLMGSGPSNVPERVLEAMARPTIGHLDPAFLTFADRTNAMLREVFRTENAGTYPVSGTGSAGMETMLVNFLEPGERLVVGVCGIFGERIVDAATRLGVAVKRVDASAGEAVDQEALHQAISQGAEALAVVHGETSTGVAQPLDGLAELAHSHDALLFVDCVTSLSGYPFELDSAGIDVAFSGTQKCLNCPPGLAPFSISKRAQKRLALRKHKVPSWCFDVSAILAYWASRERTYHHTPPINAIFGLHEALAIVLETGLAKRWKAHHAASEAVLAGLAELGARPLVAEDRRLWPLTTVIPPEGVDEAQVRGSLLSEHGIEISAGLGPLKGKVWRIGTMGVNASLDSVMTLVEAIAAIVRSDAVKQVSECAADAWQKTLGAGTPSAGAEVGVG